MSAAARQGGGANLALQRRQLLAGMAGTAAALALPAMPALALPARAADFDAAFAAQPLLRPYKGLSDSTAQLDAQARICGRWPADLRGRFHRNGPALFERGGERYHHWFDGDGMVQQFSIADGQVRHRGRLVQTRKLQAERAAGRFLYSAFGTTVPGTPPVSGPDAFNTANTSVIEHAGRLLAMWEGGSAWALDPEDLSTIGPVTWRADLAQMPFSAHPKVDPQGHLWNVGAFGRTLVVWHIGPQGALLRVQLGESPFAGGMVHDVAVTGKYIVVPLPPVRLDFGKASIGPRSFALVPGEPLRVLVMDKNDIAQRRVFELPPELVFHVGNAHDTPSGEVVLSYIGAPDAGFLSQGAVALMQARHVDVAPASTCIATLDMRSGLVRQQRIDRAGEGCEFPRVDPRRTGLPTRWLLTAAAWRPGPDGERLSQFHGVQLSDTQTGRSQRFDHGPHALAEEHVLVPKPGKTGELDAWVLGTHFDARRQVTLLNVLDAAHLEDGPLAQAELPYALPPGFHGNFTAAA